MSGNIQEVNRQERQEEGEKRAELDKRIDDQIQSKK